jgi:hydrogenase maturation protease
MKTVIIGYGSTLRSDDGAGYLAAERLAELLAPEQAEVLARHQLTPDLADTLADCERVIFIDASATAAPGAIAREELPPAEGNWGAFVHEMPPGILLRCVLETYKRAPIACLYTIGAESFEIGETLSKPVAAALPALVEQIRAEVIAG